MGCGTDKAVILPSKTVSSLEPDAREKPFPAGIKLLLCMGLSICAFVAKSPALLISLFILNGITLWKFRRGPLGLFREARLLAWQIFIITGLYIFRFGFKDGVIPGFLMAVQLFLSFFPGVIFIRTTPQNRIMASLCKIMPDRVAFVLAVSLRFIPMMIEEVRSIYEAQVYRGARILPRDLLNPMNWIELVHCLLFPAIIHCMVSANEIATAAKARGFGKYPERTHWPEG